MEALLRVFIPSDAKDTGHVLWQNCFGIVFYASSSASLECSRDSTRLALALKVFRTVGELGVAQEAMPRQLAPALVAELEMAGEHENEVIATEQGFATDLRRVFAYFRSNLPRLYAKVGFVLFCLVLLPAYWGRVRRASRTYYEKSPLGIVDNMRNPLFLWLFTMDLVPVFGLVSMQAFKGARLQGLSVFCGHCAVDATLVFLASLIYAALVKRLPNPALYAYVALLGTTFHTALFVVANYVIVHADYVVPAFFTFASYEIFTSGNVVSYKNAASAFKWLQWGSAVRYQYDAFLRYWIGQYYAKGVGLPRGVVGSRVTGTGMDFLVLHLAIVALVGLIWLVGTPSRAPQPDDVLPARLGKESERTPLLEEPLLGGTDDVSPHDSCRKSLQATTRDPRMFWSRVAFVGSMLVLMRLSWGVQIRPTKDAYLYNPAGLSERFRSAAVMWMFVLLVTPLFAMSDMVKAKLIAGLDMRGVLLAETGLNLLVSVPMTAIYNQWMEIHKLGPYLALAVCCTVFGTALGVASVAALAHRAELDVVGVLPLTYTVFTLCATGITVSARNGNPKFKWVSNLSFLRFVTDAILRIWIGQYYPKAVGIQRGFGVRAVSGVSFDLLAILALYAPLLAIVHCYAKVGPRY